MGSLESNIDSIILKIWERMGKEQELIQLSMVVYEAQENYILIRELNDFIVLMAITLEKSSQALGTVVDILQNSEEKLNQLRDLLPQHIR
jgi:hypothetical protein